MAIYQVWLSDKDSRHAITILNEHGNGMMASYKEAGGLFAASDFRVESITEHGSRWLDMCEAQLAFESYALSVSGETGLESNTRTSINDFNARLIEKITDWATTITACKAKFKATGGV